VLWCLCGCVGSLLLVGLVDVEVLRSKQGSEGEGGSEGKGPYIKQTSEEKREGPFREQRKRKTHRQGTQTP